MLKTKAVDRERRRVKVHELGRCSAEVEHNRTLPRWVGSTWPVSCLAFSHFKLRSSVGYQSQKVKKTKVTRVSSVPCEAPKMLWGGGFEIVHVALTLFVLAIETLYGRPPTVQDSVTCDLGAAFIPIRWRRVEGSVTVIMLLWFLWPLYM